MLFETDRFILRNLTRDDATQRYLDWFDDEQVKEFIISTSESIESLVEFIDSQNSDDESYLFGIFSKEDGTHIGNIKFHFHDATRKVIELGVLIGDARWRRRKVMTEIAPVFPLYCHKLFGTECVLLGVHEDNFPAVRCYEQIGFEIIEKQFFEECGRHKLIMSIDIRDFL